MSINLDDEILQDFLVEAGEIIELLGEQLVELEQSPDDYDLLNAIFRGFHTIKGGAGFLAINALVEVCHQAEDVFNILRQGERTVTPDLMDAVLQVVDVVNEMFAQVHSGEQPDSADKALLDNLRSFACAAKSDEAKAEQTVEDPFIESSTIEEKPVAKEPEEPIGHVKCDQSGAESPNQEITEDEFEQLLDTLHGSGKAPKPVPAEARQPEESDEITEDEFEALLDELSGKGKSQGKPIKSPQTKQQQQVDSAEQSAPAQPETAIPVATSKAAVQRAKPASTPKTKQNNQHASKAETTVRVDTQRLDAIMNLVGELVLVRNRLKNLKSLTGDEQLAATVTNLDVVTADLQLAVMKTRMQPIKKVFGRFPRVVRDLARSLGKEIRLELRGEETDLDKNLVESLADPLVHLVRNAVDHGIELPEQRTAASKPKEGLVVLTASQEGDHIELCIEDDGKGMNPDALRQIAVDKGLMDQESASGMDDRECYNLIFMPGFSTKTEISDVSGRGVGMDVVKTRIAQMSGSVEIDSIEGKGSKIVIKLPLTLAIMPTLMFKLDSQAFAFPLTSVVEILNLDVNKTNVVNGQLVTLVRGRALTLFYLKEWLVDGFQAQQTGESIHDVVVVNIGGKHIGFVVDELIGQEEVVIKSLGKKLQGLPGLAGATITGDGTVALILDAPGLVQKYAA